VPSAAVKSFFLDDPTWAFPGEQLCGDLLLFPVLSFDAISVAAALAGNMQASAVLEADEADVLAVLDGSVQAKEALGGKVDVPACKTDC